jgi:hypothetical protein
MDVETTPGGPDMTFNGKMQEVVAQLSTKHSSWEHEYASTTKDESSNELDNAAGPVQFAEADGHCVPIPTLQRE